VTMVVSRKLAAENRKLVPQELRGLDQGIVQVPFWIQPLSVPS
jgi:hypothetical protein